MLGAEGAPDRPAAGAVDRSVEARRLLRRIEREGGNAHQEILAVSRFHLVVADHEAGRRRQRAAAGVFEALAGRPDGLLADDAGAADLLKLPASGGDLPV